MLSNSTNDLSNSIIQQWSRFEEIANKCFDKIDYVHVIFSLILLSLVNYSFKFNLSISSFVEISLIHSYWVVLIVVVVSLSLKFMILFLKVGKLYYIC